MKITIPSIKNQKIIIAEKKTKIRTSFELPGDVLQLLEEEAIKQSKPPSQIFREIIETTHVDTVKHQKRLKNLTIYKIHAGKLQQTAENLIQEKKKGKVGANKSYAAEVLIRAFFNKKRCLSESTTVPTTL